MVSKVLLVIKSAPGEGIRAAEGLRVATAMIAMDVLPQILFLDDGVRCFVKSQMPETPGHTSFSDRLKAISDLIGIHVLSDSLKQRRLEKDQLEGGYNVKTLTLNQVADMFAQCESVIPF